MTTIIPLPSTSDGRKIKALFDNPNSFQITNDNLNFPFQCYFVGGRLENIKDVILPALRKELGMNFMFGGHKDPTKKNFPTMPFTTMMVFHLKDMSGHPIREWAKKEADDLGVPFIEIVQKIKPTVDTIQKHYPNFWEISQRFKMLRSLLPAEDCKQESDFFVFTVENFIKAIVQKEDWLIIEKNCMDKPYRLLPVNVDNENPTDFYRKCIRMNINKFLDGLENPMDMTISTPMPPRIENWYEEGANLLSDHVLSVIQGKSDRYSKEQYLEIKRQWLIDMVTDPTLDKEWTKNFHKIDLAFKSIFGCGIPSVLKTEVKDMIEMKYQDEFKHILEKQPATVNDAVINDAVAPPVEVLPPIEKDIPVMKQTDIKTETTKLLKSAGINGMKFQMTEGATLIIENIQISDLDLKECTQVVLKNVNGNQVGEMKITF
jgi:hypothetical protein